MDQDLTRFTAWEALTIGLASMAEGFVIVGTLGRVWPTWSITLLMECSLRRLEKLSDESFSH
jgi:hypothetical protein